MTHLGKTTYPRFFFLPFLWGGGIFAGKTEEIIGDMSSLCLLPQNYCFIPAFLV